MQVAATPPNAVSLNSIGRVLPTLYIAATVSSNGIMFNIPAKHNSADIKAFATPIAFLPWQGTSTSQAIGSHTNPITFCKQCDAACTACSGLPPIISTTPADAIAAAAPVSA